MEEKRIDRLFERAYTEAHRNATVEGYSGRSLFKGLYEAICILDKNTEFEAYCDHRVKLNEGSGDPHREKMAFRIKQFLHANTSFYPFLAFEKGPDMSDGYSKDSTLDDLLDDKLINIRIYNSVVYYFDYVLNYPGSRKITLGDIQATLSRDNLWKCRNLGERSINKLCLAMRLTGFPIKGDIVKEDTTHEG